MQLIKHCFWPAAPVECSELILASALTVLSLCSLYFHYTLAVLSLCSLCSHSTVSVLSPYLLCAHLVLAVFSLYLLHQVFKRLFGSGWGSSHYFKLIGDGKKLAVMTQRVGATTMSLRVSLCCHGRTGIDTLLLDNCLKRKCLRLKRIYIATSGQVHSTK